MNPDKLSTLSGPALDRAIAKAESVDSAITSEFIAVGRGHERPSETIHKTDDLSLRWRNASEWLRLLRAERAARMTWHGSTRPIRRAA